jgi:hypothetical protein
MLCNYSVPTTSTRLNFVVVHASLAPNFISSQSIYADHYQIATVSIGDAISIAKLIKDISKALGDSYGSRAEYAVLVTEMKSLDLVLKNTQNIVVESPE